jgi:hypothetical protein
MAVRWEKDPIYGAPTILGAAKRSTEGEDAWQRAALLPIRVSA